jgi:2-oxoglutarate dehydrogenase E2 component (dihydrolipoamide succinyltransferase)
MMPVEIRVPPLGESIYEATVGRWLKAAGEPVSRGEPLVELETDKVNVEVAAEADGVLASIAQPPGSVVGIGDLLGSIAEGTAAPVAATARVTPPGAASAGAAGEGAPATPLARRLAEERQIDLTGVQGSGARGRITREDVERLTADGQPAAPAAAPAPPPALPPAPAAGPDRREERVRLSRRRQTIARRLVEAQRTAAMLTTFNEADMSAVMAIRARRRDAFKERHGVGLGFMSFFTRAVVGALKAFPRLNAEIQGDEMVLKHYYDIGIAVAAEEGLVVPVVRDADRKTFAEIEREIAELAQKARSNTLSLADLQGGTFTITNGGVFGSLLSTPILNAPQVGILGMHRIQERPVALNGEVVIRPMMYLALSYDHRLVDGSEAVRFLVRVKELIEDPEALLLEG